jgi:hypothetical protein
MSLKAVFSDLSNGNLIGDPLGVKVCLRSAALEGVETGVA